MWSSSSTSDPTGRAGRAGGRRLPLWSGLLCIGLIVLMGAGQARAERIAVVEFTGPRSFAFQRGVVNVLKRRHEVVSSKRYARVARRARARRPTPRNVAKVATRLDVDAVLLGGVQRRRGRFRLTLWLRSGATGELVGKTVIVTRRRKLNRAQRRRIGREMAAAVARLGPGPRERAAQAKNDRDPREVEADTQADQETDRAPPDSDRDADEATGAGAVVSVEPASEPDRKVDVHAGLSFIGRRLSFAAEGGLADEPQSYRGTPVAGAYVSADVYPMVIAGEDELRNLGVAFTFDRVLKIQSRFAYEDADGARMEAALATSQTRWGLGLVYRYELGSEPTSPVLKAGFGYGRLSFSIDKDAAPAGVVVDLPNVDYAYFDPGLFARVPISDTLAVVAAGHYLLVMNTGEIEQLNYYGEADVLAFDIDAGVEYTLAGSIRTRAGARLMNISYDFEGTGDAAVLRDGDPATVDVPAARDLYWGGYVTAGYIY